MVNWAVKRQKAGSKFVKQGIRTAMNPSIGNMALLAYRGVKGLRAIVNSEEHELDYNVATTLSAGSFNINQLNAIAQGDREYNRTGNSSLMTRLSSTVSYEVSTPCTIREIYFIDKQQISDTPPTGGDILITSDPLSFYNVNSKGRFQILRDKTWVQSNAADPIKLKKFSKKMQKHVTFNGPLSTDIQKNGIYRLVCVTAPTTIRGATRLGFHDN